MWKDEFMEILFSNDPDKIDTKKAIKLKFDNFPSSLYQYHRFDEKNRSLLKTDKMYLSNPYQFNDPYDCGVNLISKYQVTNKDLERCLKDDPKRFKKAFNLSNKELSKLERSKNIGNKLAKFIAKKRCSDQKDPKKRIGIVAGIEKEIMNTPINLGRLKENLLVTCFSENNDSILMWSHYANHHTGFCVEYDFKLGINNHLTRNLFPVIYTNEIFSIDEYINSPEREFGNVMSNYMDGIKVDDIINGGLKLPESAKWNNMFLISAALNKFKGWEYETEWRYVLAYENQKESVYINVPKPKAIYLGANMSKENKGTVLEIGEERNIEIYQMQIESSKFALKSNKIL